MKTAIYIADGLTQLVLTPETDFEKGEQSVKIYTGNFYPCEGGWHRWGNPTGWGASSGDDSLFVVMKVKAKEV